MGVIPARRVIAEKIKTGKVDEPGPATKNVTTKSSKESVMAVKKPAIIPGIHIGIVTLKSVCLSLAPKSRAASIIEKSNSAKHAITIRKTNGKLNVVCAINIVVSPSGILTPVKKIARDTPKIMSGSIIGK
jgi:hypothetical protein